jgi:predicted transcriptional regulator of viral defense system
MNDTKTFKPDHADLFDIAAGQKGHFTSGQAHEVGFSRDLLSYHASTSRFIRVQRGLYRFRDYPSSPREDVMAAWLAVGKDTAVVSHETALELLELRDVIPNRIHLTIPRSKRYLVAPQGTVLHTTTSPIGASETMLWDGMRMTTPTRAIIDAADNETPHEHIERAVRDAMDRGLTTAGLLQQAISDRPDHIRMLIDRTISVFEREIQNRERNSHRA